MTNEPNKVTVEDYIKDRLDDQMKWYSGKSKSAQNIHKRLRTIEFICAATIPFLAGFSSLNPLVFQIIIGAAGLTIAVITALQGLYQWHEHWISYRSTAEALKREKFLFATGSAPYESDEAANFKQLVARVEALLAGENSEWAQMHKNETNKTTAVDNIVAQ